MGDHPNLGFTEAQNAILLHIGQYVYAFSYLDMAISFALADRLGGDMEIALVTLRGMDFRVKHERLFKVAKVKTPDAPQIALISDFSDRLKTEYSFRNDIAHSQIGINNDGSAFLNSFGKGFGQASHTKEKISRSDIESATQRCWRLFCEISSAFNPERHEAFLATLRDV